MNRYLTSRNVIQIIHLYNPFISQLKDVIRCIDGIKYFAEIKREIVFQYMVRLWPKIIEIANILEIPYIATKSIQSTAFALSDFYACWLKLNISLQQRIEQSLDQMRLAQTLISSLDNRKSQLFNHPVMLCAVFLDPRFYFDLTEDEKQFARMSLKRMWGKIAQFKKNKEIPPANNNVDSLEKYLAERCGPLAGINEKSNEPNFDLNADDFMNSVELYERGLRRIHHSVSILDYWTNRVDESKPIAEYFELKYVAVVVHAIPPTQVPCERSFSVTKFVFDPHRTAINPELLETLLFIRLNRDLFAQIKQEMLRECEGTN